MHGKPDKLFSFILLTLSLGLQAQKIEVKGGFVEDSLMIGQEINYWIAASYPSSFEMVFPDSLYDFSPFEITNKTYYPTEVRGDLLYDSTVYTLQSFEIDLVQYLQLNAIVFSSQDSSTVKSPKDSIYLTELAPVVTDTTNLKTNLDYLAVDRKFNYPLMYYILGGVVLIAIIGLLIFGKKIMKYFKVKRLEKKYKVFAEAFNQYINQLKTSPEPEVAEKAITIWKNYQQGLDQLAFATLTTKEILNLEFTKELEAPLKSIDRVVYGRRIQNDIYQDFQLVEDFTDERFQRKIAEIKHGK